jgi:hypothetical protein
MKLNAGQLAKLIDLAVTAKRDEIGCDGCFELMDQFAQAELDGISVAEHLEVVRCHLQQCKCCRDEYAALLESLRAICDE